MSGSLSLPALGTLNRALTHITLASYPALNIGAQNMGKTYARLNPEGDFAALLEVGAGAVASPEPYVMAAISVGVLKTQALGSAWLTQAMTTSYLGTMTVYPDSTAFPPITLSSCVIRSLDPDAYDGTDPVIKLMLRGVWYINQNMWSGNI